MLITRRVFAVILLSSAVSLSAQTGHWEGAITTPAASVTVAIDLTKSATGALEGTFTNEAKNIHGFPLSAVAIDGTIVTFAIKANAGGGTFRAAVDPDGKSMKGTFSTQTMEGHQVELPFQLTRTGEAKIAAVAKSSAVTKQLEGKWTGTLAVEGREMKLGLNVVNHADGTSTGSVVTQEGVEIAITRITQNGSAVSLDIKNVGSTYAGTVNSDGTELAGTWKQGPFEGALVFRR